MVVMAMTFEYCLMQLEALHFKLFAQDDESEVPMTSDFPRLSPITTFDYSCFRFLDFSANSTSSIVNCLALVSFFILEVSCSYIDV